MYNEKVPLETYDTIEKARERADAYRKAWDEDIYIQEVIIKKDIP